MMSLKRWIPAALLVACAAGGAAQIRTVLLPFPPYPGDEELSRMEITEDMAFVDGRSSRLVIVRGPASADARRGPGLEKIPIDLVSPIAPDLSVAVTRTAPGRWRYQYSVSNGKVGPGGNRELAC